VQSIAKIPDPLKRTFFVKEVAEKYDLYESTLLDELDKMTRKVPERFTAVVREEKKKNPAQDTAPPVPDELPVEERDLFSAMFEDPKEMIPFIFRDVQPKDFFHPVSQKLAVIVLDLFDESGTIELDRILQRLHHDKEKSIISAVAFNRYQLSERWNDIGAKLHDSRLYEIALGAIKTLKRKHIEKDLHDVRIAMKNASLSGADPMPFLKQQQELFARLKEVDALKLMKG